MSPSAIQRCSVISEIPTALAAYRVLTGAFIYVIYITYLNVNVKPYFLMI
jgi:hypothetical protein